MKIVLKNPWSTDWLAYEIVHAAVFVELNEKNLLDRNII